MPPVKVDPESVHEFTSGEELEKWMRKHHDTAPELWLKAHKKGSGKPTVSIAEALDVMLCWGWIDGIRKSLDETSFLQRYTPRRAKSIWSIVNQQHIARLHEAGRMQPEGIAQVDAAKADGRWDKAYGGYSTIVIPPELLAAIAKNRKAQATFDTLGKKNRFAMGFRLGNIKTEAAKARTIAQWVEMLARGESLLPNGEGAPTTLVAKGTKRRDAARKSVPKKTSKDT